jgi:CDP-paratose 2-epimerase
MSVVLITGSAGLIGSEAAEFFVEKGFDVVGIDNNMREDFFGSDASTVWNRLRLEDRLDDKYKHFDTDIRDEIEIDRIFKTYGENIDLVIHAAAQPSHDWAAQNPQIDFSVNAQGTLNLLESTRKFSPEAVFIYTSTNKVYGDTPNYLPLIEKETRWDIAEGHKYQRGITEDMTIDQSMHSLFGASKAAADLIVQEYGRYFGLHTVCFRGGCLTGPNHSGTQLHGFLAYLLKCTATGSPYTVFGYKGKQVRDNIHSYDLIQAFYEFYKSPRIAEVYNIGGGIYSHCSMLEAIDMCQDLIGKELNWHYSEQNRAGDHIWWISSLDKFMEHYPNWKITYDVSQILKDMYESNIERWMNE